MLNKMMSVTKPKKSCGRKRRSIRTVLIPHMTLGSTKARNPAATIKNISSPMGPHLQVGMVEGSNLLDQLLESREGLLIPCRSHSQISTPLLSAEFPANRRDCMREAGLMRLALKAALISFSGCSALRLLFGGFREDLVNGLEEFFR